MILPENVWALGMIFFSILNPDTSFPFEIELKLASEADFKDNHDQCSNLTLIADGSYRRSHTTQKRGKISHAMLRVTEEMRKKRWKLDL